MTTGDDILDDYVRAEAWLARAKADYIEGRWKMPNHETTTLILDGAPREIDKPLAPMIRALWDKGIHTRASCQGEEGPDSEAYVAFCNHDAAERFINFVTRPLMKQGVITLEGATEPWEIGKWRWSTWVDYGAKYDYQFNFCLHFPLVHADIIARQLGAFPEPRPIPTDANLLNLLKDDWYFIYELRNGGSEWPYVLHEEGRLYRLAANGRREEMPTLVGVRAKDVIPETTIGADVGGQLDLGVRVMPDLSNAWATDREPNPCTRWNRSKSTILFDAKLLDGTSVPVFLDPDHEGVWVHDVTAREPYPVDITYRPICDDVIVRRKPV